MTSQAQAGAGTGVHRVRPGETLSGIAHTNAVSLATLLRDNPHISNPDLIRPGETIRLPGRHARQNGAGHGGPAANGLSVPKPPTRPGPVNAPSRVPGVSAAGFAFIYDHEHEAGVSRHLSWPGGNSGVTLGAGYDMGGRSADQIRGELSAIGLPSAQAEVCAAAAGLRRHPARDYGHAHRTEVDMTGEQERALLAFELRHVVAAVHTAVHVPLTQHQQDALISFAFNIGEHGFRSSTTLRLLNQGDYAGAAERMKDWNKSGGEVMRGLVNRRRDEVEFFNKPDASGPRATLPAVPARAGTPLSQPSCGGGGPERYARIVERRGNARATADLREGKLVLLGLRTPRKLTFGGSYDDTMVIVRKVGGSFQDHTFRLNTLPDEEYLTKHYTSRGRGPVGGSLGEIDSGQTVAYTRGIFHGKALRADSNQTVKIRRDTNHDHRIDSRDCVTPTAGASGMHIHVGGRTNTWSEGCQTLPPDEHHRFFATLERLAPNQQHFHYVLVDAPG